MTECLLKLLHAAYHAHLAGALGDHVPLQWCSVEDSDDDSVLV